MTTTLSVDLTVKQSEERFRNEVMRAYHAAKDVDEYAFTTRNLKSAVGNTPGESMTIGFRRLLTLQFSGQLLIQFTNDSGTISFTQRNGVLVLPTSGTIVLTNTGTSQLPCNIKYVAT